MTEIVNPNAAIEAIPSSDAFDTESVVESAPSEAGSSASHAATPDPAFVWPWPWPWPWPWLSCVSVACLGAFKRR